MRIEKAKLMLGLALVLSLGISLLSSRFNAYYLDVIIGIGINIILAVSLNLINGYTGQFSLGHAGFMAVGAYVSGYVSTTYSPQLVSAFAGQNWLVAVVVLLVGALAAAVAGFLVGLPSLRLKGDYLAIVTLGFGEIIRVILQNMNQVGGSRGLSVSFGFTNFFWTYAMAAVAIYVVGALVNSTYGRGFIAVHDDEVAAEAMGVNTTRYKVTAFVIGAFFAGMAGSLYAHFKQFITPSGFDFVKSVEIVVMVILGGMGNMVGVVIAAVVITILPEVLRPIAAYRMIIFSLLLVVLMLVCPNGLFQPRFFLRPWQWIKRHWPGKPRPAKT